MAVDKDDRSASRQKKGGEPETAEKSNKKTQEAGLPPQADPALTASAFTKDPAQELIDQMNKKQEELDAMKAGTVAEASAQATEDAAPPHPLHDTAQAEHDHAAEEQRTQMQAEIREQEHERQELAAKSEALQHKIEEHEHKIEEHQQSVVAVVGELDEIATKAGEKVAALQQLDADLHQKLDAFTETSGQQLETLGQQLTEATTQFDEQWTTITEGLEAGQTAGQELAERITAAQEQAKTDFSALTEQHDQLKQESQARREAARQQFEEIKQRLTALTEAVKQENDVVQQQVEAYHQAVEQAKASLQQQTQTVNTKSDAFSEQIKGKLQTFLATFDQKMGDASRKLDELEEAIGKVTDEQLAKIDTQFREDLVTHLKERSDNYKSTLNGLGESSLSAMTGIKNSIDGLASDAQGAASKYQESDDQLRSLTA